MDKNKREYCVYFKQDYNATKFNKVFLNKGEQIKQKCVGNNKGDIYLAT